MARQSDRLRKSLDDLKANIQFHYEQGCSLEQHIIQLPPHTHQVQNDEDNKIDLQKQLQLQALEQMS